MAPEAGEGKDGSPAEDGDAVPPIPDQNASRLGEDSACVVQHVSTEDISLCDARLSVSSEAAGVRSCPRPRDSGPPRCPDTALAAADLSVTGRRFESRLCPTAAAVNHLLCLLHKEAIERQRLQEESRPGRGGGTAPAFSLAGNL